MAALTDARIHMLQTALDREDELQNELADIVLCKPNEVAKALRLKDFRILEKYIPIPYTQSGNIDMGGARKLIIEILDSTPAFRSCDPEYVCQCIVTYYMHNPDQIQTRTIQDRDPRWFTQVSGENTPNASPVGSPRPGLREGSQRWYLNQLRDLNQENDQEDNQ